MKYMLLFALAISTITCVNTNKQYKQIYPNGLDNYNYASLIHPKILESASPEFNYAGFSGSIDSIAQYIQTNHLKSIKYIHYDGLLDDEVTMITKFDKYGNLVYQSYVSSSGAHFKYLFNKNGTVNKKQTYPDDGTFFRELDFFYDTNNNITYYTDTHISDIEISKDTTYFEYDSRGNVIKAGCTILKYDDNNNCIEQSFYDCSDYKHTIVLWKAEYDDNGRLTKRSLTNATGHIEHYFENLKRDSIFDETNNLLSQVNHFDKQKMNSEIFIYHPRSNKLTEYNYYLNGNIKEEKFYKYYR